jgi:tetratricopeptide (TPR) repeat protein
VFRHGIVGARLKAFLPMLKKFKFVLRLLGALALSGQLLAVQAQSISSAEGEVGGPIPERQLTEQIMFQVLAAEIAAQRGQFASASRTYFDMAKDTRDPRMAQRATELGLASRSMELALPAAQLWMELAPKSLAAAQTMEALWLSSGKLSDAEPLLAKRLSQARKDKTIAAAYQQVLRVLPQMPDKKGALAMMLRLTKEDQQVADARLAVAIAAMQAEQPDRALLEARAAVKLAPSNEELVIGAARVLSITPAGTDEAIEVLSAMVKRQPKALDVYFLLGRLQLQKGQAVQARQTFEAALKKEPDSPTLMLALAQIAYQGKAGDAKSGEGSSASEGRDLALAETYLLKILSLPASVQRDEGLVHAFLGQISEDRKDDLKAREWYSKVGPGDQYITAITRRAILMAKAGQLEEGRSLLKGVASTGNRERIALTSAEAQMLTQAKRLDEAFAVLDSAVQTTRNTPEFLYEHALAAEKINKLDVMEQSLRHLIELRPDAAHAYNALGYSFAERNVRLPEARDLIAKSLELRPDDPHILDSMGWVLFRQGDLDKAREYLERALKISPEVDVLVHLGEVLWKQGRQNDALKYWLDARKIEPENESLKETMSRLKVSF